MHYILPLTPAAPELFLLAMACVILIADLFVADRNRVVTYALTQAALAGSFAITFFTAAAEPAYTFSGMFVDDYMSDVLKLGAYGFIRLSLPIVPDASHLLAGFVIALSLIAVVYIGLVALVQSDMKKLIAY